MLRRGYLAGLVALPGVAVAGCAEVTGGLEVVAIDSRETTFGNIQILARVENHGSDTETGTLAGEVDLDNGSSYTERTSVTVPGDTISTESVSIDIPVSTSLSGGRYQYDASIE